MIKFVSIAILVASMNGIIKQRQGLLLTCFVGSVVGAVIMGSGLIDPVNGKTYSISDLEENQEIEVGNLNNDQAGLDKITAVIKTRYNKTYILVLKRSDVSDDHLKTNGKYIKRGDRLFMII